MAITILPPAPAALDYDDDSDDGERFDEEGDVAMGETDRPSKRARSSTKGLVTPGEIVTEDPQWMRYVEHLGMLNCISFAEQLDLEVTAHISLQLPQT